MRAFLHADDLADACAFLMQRYDYAQLGNIGWGRNATSRDLAALVAARSATTAASSGTQVT